MALRNKDAKGSSNSESSSTLPCLDGACGVRFSGLAALPDNEVMHHLKAGNHDAMAVLFDRYHRLVLSIALRILRDDAEAEDLMQTVFFEIYRVAGQFNPVKGTTKAWLLQYAYHRSLNRRHYLKLRGFYDSPDSARVKGEELPYHPNHNVGLNSQELARLVQEGLAALTRPQRTTLELAFFEGLSMAEIADHLKESVSNVRHHYYRGMEKLRSYLYRELPSERTAVALEREVFNVKA